MSGWSSHGTSSSRVRVVVVSAVIGGAALFSPGCAPAVPTFPPLERDAGIECDATTPCPEGESCLQGLCYAMCDATHACGPREMCESGVCVLRVGDAGSPPDAGPPPVDAPMDSPTDTAIDPCVGVRCMLPTAICRDGVCVECELPTDCGGASPICDVGRGTCVSFAPEDCAPCNSDLDCPTTMGMPTRHCTSRAAPEPEERVCLASCSAVDDCPTGFRCDSGSALCLPTIESCTGYLSGLRARPCVADVDCPQIGATVDTGLITGACSDDGMGMVCHYACGLPTDCPAPLSCVAGFCRP